MATGAGRPGLASNASGNLDVNQRGQDRSQANKSFAANTKEGASVVE